MNTEKSWDGDRDLNAANTIGGLAAAISGMGASKGATGSGSYLSRGGVDFGRDARNAARIFRFIVGSGTSNASAIGNVGR